jgi:prepilin-type N-terminal cleavage/methylation domain-containing protein
MKEKKKNTQQGGFTMIEMIIAVSILSFGIVAMYGAFSSMVILTSGISSRFTAAYLAQEGLEIIRNLRDDNFISIAASPSGDELLWSSELLTTPCTSGCMVDYKTINTSQLVADSGVPLALDSDGFYGYTGGTPTMFHRTITIAPVSGTADAIQVDVLVTWDYNGQSFSFDANEYLYNWYRNVEPIT